ncbi:MAG: NfeD family protein [Bacillota bacterium]|nr:NfeD family protein [Bacillota bacterium]
MVLLALAVASGFALAFAADRARSQQAPGDRTVYVLSIEGPIEPGLAAYLKRGIDAAEGARAAAVLIEVDTFGGRVDAATEIRDLIFDLGVPSVAFVKGRAWSAGALVTLAAEKIAMAPGASIGAAETIPKEEKTISALRGEFEATAETRGRDPEVAAAMVDADVVIEGLIGSGKLLTLTAQQAKEIGFIDLVAGTRREVLREFGFSDARLVDVRQNWAEKVARFLTEPTVSSMLLIIGFLGLLFEVTSPGWGVPGTAGVAALALFFGGRMIAGIAGWEVAGLFILGFILLMAEAFLIPGFGIAGIGGIVAIFASLVLSFRDVREAAFVISFSLVVTAFIVATAFKYLGRSPALGRFILRTSEGAREGYVATPGRQAYLGRVGKTLTVMRPSGTVLVDDARLDAVSEGDFIPKGAVVEVVNVDGPRLVVRVHEEGE